MSGGRQNALGVIQPEDGAGHQLLETTRSNRVLAVIGPTATGKSALGIALARRLNGEIVNADSRQVYRRLDIGTAKLSLSERSIVPHHLIDLVEPDAPFSIGEYAPRAHETIRSIMSRGKLPILVGGSGLYIRALLDGLAPPPVAPNPELRAMLEAQIGAQGVEGLLGELRAADPIAAERIDPRNHRRLIRAIEVVRITGRPFSEQGTRRPALYESVRLGLTLDRAELYRRIDARVDTMFLAGFVEEVQALLASGLAPSLPSLSSVGYQEVIGLIQGQLSEPEAKQRIKYRTHRLARQQYTWFRLDDPAITWLSADAPDLVERAIESIGRR